MLEKRLSRRELLRAAVIATVGVTAAACAPKIVEKIVKETVVVEKQVEKIVEKEVTKVVKEIVKETVMVAGTPQVVEKEVTKIVKEMVEVEKVVIATAAPPATIELKVSTDWNSGGRKEYMDQAVAAYMEQNPNVNVEIWHMGGGGGTGPGGMSDIVVAQMLTDTVADMVMGWGTMLFERREYLTDITDQLEIIDFDIEDYYYAAESCKTPDKRIYGIPWGHSVSGWIYNKTMFQEEGVPEPTDDWTWWEMLEAAEKLTNPDKQQFGVWARMLHDTGQFPHMWAAGGTFRTMDGSKTNMCTPGAVAAFERYIDLIYAHKVSPDPSEQQAIAGVTNAFAEGKIGMSPWLLHGVGGVARNVGDRFEWACMPTPKDPDNKTATTRELTEPWFITEMAEKRGNLEEICKLGAFFVSDWGQELLIKTGAFMPGKKGWLDNPEFLKPMPLNKEQISKNMDSLLLMPQMYFTHWSEWFTTYYYKELTKAWTGEIPAKDAALEACAAADAVLAKYPSEPWLYDYGFHKEVGY